MAAVGPLPDDAWDYLLDQASESELALFLARMERQTRPDKVSDSGGASASGCYVT